MRNKQRKQTGAVSEPHVGIFWLVGEKLLFDTTPLSRAEEYGECRIHSGNHVSVWERFRFARTVPQEMEYEEPPRGRVVFNAKKSEFSLLADRCIGAGPRRCPGRPSLSDAASQRAALEESVRLNAREISYPRAAETASSSDCAPMVEP